MLIYHPGWWLVAFSKNFSEICLRSQADRGITNPSSSDAEKFGNAVNSWYDQNKDAVDRARFELAGNVMKANNYRALSNLSYMEAAQRFMSTGTTGRIQDPALIYTPLGPVAVERGNISTPTASLANAVYRCWPVLCNVGKRQLEGTITYIRDAEHRLVCIENCLQFRHGDGNLDPATNVITAYLDEKLG